MSAIKDFIGMATQKLGVSQDSVEEGTSGLLMLIRKHVGEADFGKIASAIPGAADLAKAKAGAGIGGVLGGIASKAGEMFGKHGAAAGALGALTGAGLTGEKATGFLSLFTGFLKSSLAPDLLKAIAGKVPGLSSLV